MFEPLYAMPASSETRWASHENPSGKKGTACHGNDGRKRNACICPLKAGETATLAEVSGTSGMIRRIWCTISDRSPAMLRGLRLRMTWDNADQPAVDVPFADFFGHGIGTMSSFENALFSSPEGKSFNCCIPMPFRTAAKITITNETETELKMFFYDVNFTVNDLHDANALYFHAHWRRENPTRLGEDYEILPRVIGRGRVLGSVIGVLADTQKYFKSWWGEGEVKFFLDGDTEYPTLCGTGTEDYVGTGWGQGRYSHAYQGCPVADEENFRYSLYRLHIPDPIWFHAEARMTIQQIGCWNPETMKQFHEAGIPLHHGADKIDTAEAIRSRPYGFFERQDDWSSCAWFYLATPTSNLPALAPLPDRIAGLDATTVGTHALA